MKKRYLALLMMGTLIIGSLAMASPPPSSYRLLKRIPLGAAPGGEEYFDYLTVDTDARRIYLSHGTEVKVIDADSFAVVGTISGLQKCHGIALVKDLGKGFITDADAGQVAVFDIKSLKITGRIETNAPGTDSIVYDPASKHIFAFNGDSKNASVIDPNSETLIKTIYLWGSPEFPVADGKGMIYDDNEDLNVVMAIDTKTNEVKDKWPVAPEGAPVALAIDRAHRRLFSAGRGPQFLVVMDADNGKVIQSFPISGGVDATVYEPETGLIFSSTRDGKIHTFHEDSPDKYREAGTVETEFGAKTMAVDPRTHNLFLTTSDFGPVPAPTLDVPHRNRPAIRGTFRLLIYRR
ncbi:MAG: YncE family protein [Terriglobia bacterium]